MSYELNCCNTKNEFIELKKRTAEISREIKKILNKLTAFHKQKLSNELDTLNNLVSIKDSVINGKKFEFYGDPIPRSSGTIKKVEKRQIRSPLGNGVSNIYNLRKIIDSTDSHLLLKDFADSIISGNKIFPSIHVQDGKDSILYLESNGPIFMHSLKNMTLFLKCHQLRLHNIKNCTLLIEVANNKIIIEDCKNLKIGPFSPDNHQVILVDDFNKPNTLKDSLNYEYISNNGIYEVLPLMAQIGEGPLMENVIGKLIK